MRISSNLVFSTGLNTIQRQQSDFLHLYQQIGSGQRMVTPADDPLAASQTINIAQSQSLNRRYADNRAVAQQNLGREEDALNSLTLLLQDVRTQLVEAGNGALADADRRSLAEVLSNARRTALGIANTTDGNGQYLFSGSQGGTPAYRDDGTYAGDRQQRHIQADETRRIAGGDIGPDIFARSQPGSRGYTASAANGNMGTAVLSSPSVVDAQGGNAEADYRFEIQFTTGTDYEVTVRDGQGQTVETRSGSLSASATELDLGYGTRVTWDGAPAAGDQFTVQPLQQDDTNLFNTLDRVIAALRTPVQDDPVAKASLRNVLNAATQHLDDRYDNVLTVRASIGARLNELTALDDSGTQRDLGYTKALSGLEDLDYYDASMQLSLRKAALEGAAMAFQTIQGLTLFSLNGGR